MSELKKVTFGGEGVKFQIDLLLLLLLFNPRLRICFHLFLERKEDREKH